MNRSWQRIVPPLAALVGAGVAAELIVRVSKAPAYLLPPPSAVLATLLADRHELADALASTALASGVGFGLSAIGGALIAVVLSSGRWVQRAFYPYAIFFQTVPIIAIAPLLVIWFGYGLEAVIASAFIVSVFPMIANTLSGLLAADPALRDLFRLYGAGPATTMLKLRLPGALPYIMTGLRITAGLSVIGAIVGEFIGGGGLGSVVDTARTQQRTDKVFAAVVLASFLGLGMLAVVNLASRVVLRHWHASERQ